MSQKIFSVTELNSAIKEMLEGVFPEIFVEGEISNLKTYPSGHSYFDLKDEDSLVSSVFFKGYANYLGVKLKNGLFVIVKAEVSCYVKQGKYQLIVKDIKVQKTGSLYLAFERLKKKLAAEGLFDENRKKPIPAFPEKIAVVTSLQGAAVRDIISILKRRHSGIEIFVYPVLVQGENAKHEIVEAIKDLNKFMPQIDVMLLGRGGGSIEDLWAFNEEIVAREIARSKIPIISCIGHETDFTIADFVSDLRAPTPSAAAELVVKNKKEVIFNLHQLSKNLIRSLTVFYERLKAKFDMILHSHIFKTPEVLWRSKALEIDRLSDALVFSQENKISSYEAKVNNISEKLAALSPNEVLKRGYSIVRKYPKKEVVKDSAQAIKGDRIEVQLFKGILEGEITNKRD